MRRLILFIFVFMCIALTACSSNSSEKEKSIEDIKRELLTTKAYSCNVNVFMTNNLSTSEYKLKHFYKAPDKYRIEVLRPKEMKGYITIHNGKSSYVYHANINAYFKMDNFEDTSEHNAFVGAFIKYFLQTDKAKVTKKTLEDRSYYVLELIIPGDNRYLHKERLWMDAKEAKPYMLEVLDTDDNIRIKVAYDDFNKNIVLEDSQFEIPLN